MRDAGVGESSTEPRDHPWIRRYLSEMSLPTSAPKADRPWYKKKRIMIPLVVVLLFAIGSMGSEEDGSKPAENKTEKVAVPTTPKGKLLAAIKAGDRDIESPRVSEYTTTDDGKKYAEIKFKVKDNFGNKTIRTGIAQDVFSMAEAALKSGVPFDELAFRGMFPLTDKYGNDSLGQVFFTTFTRDTLKKIKFDNVVATQYDNIENLSIDGIVMLHPDFRG